MWARPVQQNDLLPPNGSAGMQLATANVNNKRGWVFSMKMYNPAGSRNRDTAFARLRSIRCGLALLRRPSARRAVVARFECCPQGEENTPKERKV